MVNHSNINQLAVKMKLVSISERMGCGIPDSRDRILTSKFLIRCPSPKEVKEAYEHHETLKTLKYEQKILDVEATSNQV